MKDVAYKSKWTEKTEAIIGSWGQGPQQVMTLVFLWGYGKHLESILKCGILDPDYRKSDTAFGEPKSQHFNKKPVPSEAGWRSLEKPRPSLRSVVVLYLVVWLEGAGRIGPHPNWQIIKALVNPVKRVDNSADKSIWFCNPNNYWIDQVFLLPATY